MNNEELLVEIADCIIDYPGCEKSAIEVAELILPVCNQDFLQKAKQIVSSSFSVNQALDKLDKEFGNE
jgi:hypothetical protein